MINELHNHADVESLRQKVKNIYAWDFIFCDGDSIKEKYQKLYEIVSTICVRECESTDTALVVASDAISGFLLVCHDHDECICNYDERDGITFIGNFRRICGNNGYHTSFHLYRDDKLGDEECLVANGNKVSVVKLFNCPV